METASTVAPPLKGLRGQILLELKRSQPLTVKELAERHRVTPNAVRRHLKELEADQVIEYGREQRGRGAPTFAYRLTDAGEALFPKRYAEQLTHVLNYLAQRSGREEVRRFFDEQFRNQAESLLPQLRGSTFPERVQAVVELLQRQGFMAEWSIEGGTVRIAEHNCAVQAIAEKYPELCDAEADFLRGILETDVRRAAHIPQGCNACEYAVSVGGAKPPTSAEQR